MKRAIALAAALLLMLSVFAACKKKNIIVDYEGNEHTLVMKDGAPAQDKNGNLIEKITDAQGKTVTQPVSYPNVIKNSRREIENAFFKLKIPSGWKFDDSIRAFRIQHDGACTTSGEVCEITTATNKTGDVEDYYDTLRAREKAIELIGGDQVSDLKEFEAKLFGQDCKALSARHNDRVTLYTYVFPYGGTAVSVTMMINDECKTEDFDPEAFLEDIMTLKTLG